MSFQHEINNSLKILNDGRILLYPTDTVWGIGCDATDEDAVSKIYNIKKRTETKSLVILVDSLEMLHKTIIHVPVKILEIIKSTTIPTSIIYENPVGLAKNVIAKDNTVAIRITTDPFCKELINHLGKPIVSTSANISGEPTPQQFSDIQKEILHSVDYVVDLYKDQINTKSSRIIKCKNDGNIQIIRD